MSKPDKHTPLSPEELFKLLEDNSGKATDFDGMDDFEKEALEGFAKFSTPEKTRAMVEDVNLGVSKKVNEGPGTKKNRVIWFSAAASIVLLVMVSMFFLKQSKKDTASTIVLNDITPPPTAQPVITAPETEVTEPGQVENANSAAGQASARNANVKEEDKQEQGSRMKAQDTKPVAGLVDEVAQEERKTTEPEKNNIDAIVFTYNKGNADAKDASVLKKSEFETGDKLAAVKPSANTKTQTETTINGYTSPASGSSNSSSAPVTIQQNTTKYDDRMEVEKASEKMAVEKKAGKSKAKEKAPAYESEMDQEIETAYFKGGEPAVKEYVLAYLQKTAVTVTGKYKVKATVLTNGALKVKSVNHITNEVCKDCENTVKKALNDMTGWTPAMWGKTASESSVDFVLSF